MAEVNAGVDDCDDGRCAASRGIPRIGDADEAVPPKVGAAIIPGRVIGLSLHLKLVIQGTGFDEAIGTEVVEGVFGVVPTGKVMRT